MSSLQAMRAPMIGLGLLAGLPLCGLVSQDPVLAWAWAGVVAPAAGALASGAERPGAPVWRPWLTGLVAALVLGLALPGLPSVGGALGAVAGLAGLGWGLGLWAGERRGALAIGLFVAAALSAVLPGLGGVLGDAPWAPEVAAGLLRASPATFVVESGGVDWLRHSAIYDPVGGDSIGPSLHQAWGSLAGLAPGVVGFGVAALWLALRRAPKCD
ncbi:MAG: hypothetical protein ACI8QC_003247 [Planctomycetota bacterium]|jgi:hypothetical protein